MKVFIGLAISLVSASLWANDVRQFEQITSFKGTYNEASKVFKVNFPRTDVKITVDGRILDPFMGLTSWVAFKQMNENHFMLMGDLVLFQDEVNPVMISLLKDGLNITALHNHFFYDHPKVYFMHVEGKGSLKALANGIKDAMEISKQVRSKNLPSDHFEGPSIVQNNSIDSLKLESIFGTKGQSTEGMTKFVFGRNVKVDGIDMGADMGVNTWAAFGGSHENAVVDGDFAVMENELQPVLKVLSDGGINIVAIHNHMTGELPRMIFLHYWGKGNAEALAKTIKLALAQAK